MKMNLTKQERLAAMGKFACFVHRWLVPAAGVLFVVVGLAKVASVFGEAELLGKPDPVFGLVWRELMVVAGLVEIASGLASMLGRFLRFNMVCSVGMFFAIGGLHLLHMVFGFNLYVANLVVIFAVAVGKFLASSWFVWKSRL